jgi:hypothetical protein
VEIDTLGIEIRYFEVSRSETQTKGFEMTGTTVIAGVRLADGTEHRFQLPASKHDRRYWKSWLMRQCPYGTVFTGCEFYAYAPKAS